MILLFSSILNSIFFDPQLCIYQKIDSEMSILRKFLFYAFT